MKNLEYYMKQPYEIRIVEDTVEGGYTGYYPDLPGCVTCAETLPELFSMLEDAKRCWLQDALEDHLAIPEVKPESTYSGRFNLRVPKKLHKQLAEQAQRNGVSLNLYCTTLLAEGCSH